MTLFLKSLMLLCLFFVPTFGFGFFEIAEVLPNTNDDTNLEYITLKNLKNTPQTLSGYTLQDASGKTYTFTGILLQSQERKQFFRPVTKIILNNTDEILTLFSSTGAKIDEIKYTSSSKGVFLSFEDIILEDQDTLISNEPFISSEVYISNEVIFHPNDGNTNQTETTNVFPVPEISFRLQRPSYISQSGSIDQYVCDPKQTECKVNFDLSSSFTYDFPSREYRCELDFGLGFVTGEEQKCNPNTVIFPEGTTQVRFKIIHTKNVAIFSEKTVSLFFQKQQVGQGLQKSPSGVSGSENPTESPRIHIVDPIIQIQSGVAGLGTNFFCEKAQCKVNLKYEKHHSLERCYWNFSSGEQASENTHKSCNPGVVTFGPGVHELSLRVYESSRESNEKVVRFFIHNVLFFETQSSLEPLSSELGEGITSLQALISLQGRLSKEKILGEKMLQCSDVEKCFVNFEAILDAQKEKGRSLQYIWKKNGEIFSQKQNPSGIWLETGSHHIVLELYEAEILLSSDIWSIEVSGKIPVEKKKTETAVLTEENMSFSGRIYEGLILGNILPNPVGSDIKEFIEIRNISPEKRMLGGCILSDTTRKYNLPDEALLPGASRYLLNKESKISLGNTKDSVTLTCNGKVYGTQSYDKKMQENEFLSGEVFPGFSLKEIQSNIPETFQQEYIEKHISLSFTVLKREGLKISGTAFPNTKLEIFSGEGIFFTLETDATGKFLLKTKSILAGEYSFGIRLVQQDSSFTFQDFKKLSLSSSQRASWFASRSSKTKKPTVPKLLVSREPPQDISQDIPTLSTKEKILFIFLILCVGIGVFGHIFFLTVAQRDTFFLQKEVLCFQIRQKIILLGV